ncbi:MAG: M48 family metallopeptidase [Clostridia bacterium]|nr:M48 family metallopeptidase [Clostridia bacterium]
MEKEIIEYKLFQSNIKNLYIQIKEGKVIVKAPKYFSKSQIDEIVGKKQKWIEKNLQHNTRKQQREENYTKQEFIQIVEENVKDLIQLTNLKPNRVRIRDIHYAWGTCSSNRNITINQKLICYSKKAIRYVILHELCHLEYMNHSGKFWELLETYMPDYKEAKKELK